MSINLRTGIFLLSCALLRVLEAQTVDADALYQANVASLSQKKFQDAEAGFRKLTQLEPNRSRGVIGLAETEMAEQNSDEAIAFLQTELKKKPSLELYLALGDCAARIGEYDLALAQFQTVLTRMTSLPAPDLYLNGPGSSPDPLEQSLNVLSAKRNSPRGLEGVYVRIAEVAWRKGDLASAVAANRKLTEINPSAPLYTFLGTLLEQAGQKEDAAAAYRAAIKLSPDNGPALNNLAYMIAETGGNLDEALQYAKHSEKLMPGVPQPVDTVGWIFFEQGKFDAAIVKFSEALRLAPADNSFRAHMSLALDRKSDGLPDTEALRTALKAEPTTANQTRIRELLTRMGK